MSALVSVIVATYNPDWTNFRNTLRSIICQENVDFDIVISDDGSKVDHFDKVEQFFQENNFHAYKLVKNTENQGTVKNVISALQNTDSQYIKGISPGDYLYDENTLYEFVKFAEKNPADAYFGNAVFYSVADNHEVIIYGDKRNPKDLTPWIEKNYRKIKRNYLYRMDYILGAAVFCKRQYICDYLLLLKDVVKYAEDMFLMYGITNKDNILYVNRTLVFYEYGSGISTNADTHSIVSIDIRNFKEWLYKKHKISFFTFLFGKTKKHFFRSILRLFLDPFVFFNRFKKVNDNYYGIEQRQSDMVVLKQIIE
ncbi:MAG: glycosyltransferase [Bacteroidales bacterium]|nr:glycosyltransferase [Bacteroidales bacterium]